MGAATSGYQKVKLNRNYEYVVSSEGWFFTYKINDGEVFVRPAIKVPLSQIGLV